MRWNIKTALEGAGQDRRLGQLIHHLLSNRGLKTKSQIADFLHPPHPQDLTLRDVGLKQRPISQTIAHLAKAIDRKQTVAIYGDYDADGITATAILWLTLHRLGAQVHPFIPDRQRHGYGLSVAGVTDLVAAHHPDLIITVDNGIVAHEAAAFVRSQNIDLIITDHHQPGKTLPEANLIVHSDQVAGSGISWFLAREIINHLHLQGLTPQSLLDLLTIGTVADLMPMLGPNRSLVTHGLKVLTETTRIGLIALKKEAGLTDPTTISTYEVGFIIAPRINAMGRLEHGLDALRLLCTTDPAKAKNLAGILGNTNRTRQDLTVELMQQADQIYQTTHDQSANIIIIDHQEFHEGVIGLIAGRLSEKYSKPTIVISRGEAVSKASARSVAGVNIIELIRTHQDLLLGAGGHPGAAGFSVATEKIATFREAITATAASIPSKLLTKNLDIDCQLDFTDLTPGIYQQIKAFAPFGLGNPTPTFAAFAKLVDFRPVGRDHEHLKLTVTDPDDPHFTLDAIAFRRGYLANQLEPDSLIQVAFTLDENTWNNHTKLQLIIKDIKTN